MHRRPVGVVELDPLMGLEVAAHRRAEPVGLVDIGLVGEIDRAAKPGVAKCRRGYRSVRGAAVEDTRAVVYFVSIKGTDAAGEPDDGAVRIESQNGCGWRHPSPATYGPSLCD